MSKHPNTVQGKTAEELAKEFARTTYGYQAEFLESLVRLYEEEVIADSRRGYDRLASTIHCVLSHIYLAIRPMKHAWKICKGKTEAVDEDKN